MKLTPLGYALSALFVLQPTIGQAQSQVGTFRSTVTVGGPVEQKASGSGNKQELNVGSATNSRANSFNAVVKTGAIRQSAQGVGVQQTINVGAMKGSQANSFNANVNAGSIEQISGKSGARQEIDIGSVNNSTVSGAANVTVNVRQGIRQTGDGEIVLGSVKDSNVGSFSQNLNVQGKIVGNNVRMGSVVGQERYDSNGNHVGRENSGGQPRGLGLPDFSGQERNIKTIEKISSKTQVFNSMVFGMGMHGAGAGLRGVGDTLTFFSELDRFASTSLQFLLTDTVGRFFMSEDERKKNKALIQERENEAMDRAFANSIGGGFIYGAEYLEKMSAFHYRNAAYCNFIPESCDYNLFKSLSDIESIDSSLIRKGSDYIGYVQAGGAGVKIVKESFPAIKERAGGVWEGLKDGANKFDALLNDSTSSHTVVLQFNKYVDSVDKNLTKEAQKVTDDFFESFGSKSFEMKLSSNPTKHGFSKDELLKIQNVVNDVKREYGLVEDIVIYTRAPQKDRVLLMDAGAAEKKFNLKNKTAKPLDYYLNPDFRKMDEESFMRDVNSTVVHYRPDFKKTEVLVESGNGLKVKQIHYELSDEMKKEARSLAKTPEQVKRVEEELLSLGEKRLAEFEKGIDSEYSVSNGQVFTPGGKRITSDIDVFAFSDRAGKPLPSVIHENLVRRLQENGFIQHDSVSKWALKDSGEALGRLSQIDEFMSRGGYAIEGGELYEISIR